jgi:hypothetical protein
VIVLITDDDIGFRLTFLSCATPALRCLRSRAQVILLIWHCQHALPGGVVSGAVLMLIGASDLYLRFKERILPPEDR